MNRYGLFSAVIFVSCGWFTGLGVAAECDDLKRAIQLIDKEQVDNSPIRLGNTACKRGDYHGRPSLACEGRPLPKADSAKSEQLKTEAAKGAACLGAEWSSNTAFLPHFVALNHSKSPVVVMYSSGLLDTLETVVYKQRPIQEVQREKQQAAAKIVAPPTPTQFCAELKEVIQSTNNDFATILGRKRSWGGWGSKVQFSGWSECDIREFKSGAKYFTCGIGPYPNEASSAQARKALGEYVQQCLGKEWYRVKSNAEKAIFESEASQWTIQLRSREDSTELTWAIKLEIERD